MVPGASIDVSFCVCDNGLFVVGLTMHWAVFVFLACAKLKVSCVSVYSHLQLKCSVYRYIVDICKTPAQYIPIIHPEKMRYRHTQVEILNRARQWTLCKFTTHSFSYEI